MANNEQALNRAKTEGEPALVKAFRLPNCDFPLGSVINAYQASDLADKKLHVDVYVHYAKPDGKRRIARIDEKDPDRIDTGNVTVPVNEIEFFREYDEEAQNYFLAFRLNDGVSTRYDKFRVFAVSDVLSYIDTARPAVKHGKQQSYYLLSMSDLTASEPYFEVGL